MRPFAFASLTVLAAYLAVSCGPHSGSQQQPGVAQTQTQQDSINQRIDAGQAEEQELAQKTDDLRRQIASAQADLDASSSGAENEINQRTEVYAAQDMQVQNQQLEIQIVRSKLASQIQNQKSVVNQLQSLVAQEVNWGFESPELDAFSKRDVEILTLLASQAAVAIENARLYQALSANEARLERELRFAKRVQTALLPTELPKQNLLPALVETTALSGSTSEETLAPGTAVDNQLGRQEPSVSIEWRGQATAVSRRAASPFWSPTAPRVSRWRRLPASWSRQARSHALSAPASAR